MREVLDVELSEGRVLELMRTGKPIRDHMALLDTDAADHLVTAFVECYRLERGGLARPFPGVVGLLGRLQGAALGVAVVTSKLREDALAELRATGLDAYVDVVIAFEDTAEHKPAAAPHLEALRLVRAQTGISVGDLPSEVASARAAGLAAMGVSWGTACGMRCSRPERSESATAPRSWSESSGCGCTNEHPDPPASSQGAGVEGQGPADPSPR